METRISKDLTGNNFTVTSVNPVAQQQAAEAIRIISSRSKQMGLEPWQILEALYKGQDEFSAFGMFCRTYYYMFRVLPTWLASAIGIFSLYTFADWIVRVGYPTLKEWIAEIPFVGSIVSGWLPDDETQRDSAASKYTPLAFQTLVGMAVPAPLHVAFQAIQAGRGAKTQPSAPIYGPPAPATNVTTMPVGRPSGFRSNLIAGLGRGNTAAAAQPAPQRPSKGERNAALIGKGIDLLGSLFKDGRLSEEEARVASRVMDAYLDEGELEGFEEESEDSFMDETSY